MHNFFYYFVQFAYWQMGSGYGIIKGWSNVAAEPTMAGSESQYNSFTPKICHILGLLEEHPLFPETYTLTRRKQRLVPDSSPSLLPPKFAASWAFSIIFAPLP